MAQAPAKLFTEVDEGIAFMSGRDKARPSCPPIMTAFAVEVVHDR